MNILKPFAIALTLSTFSYGACAESFSHQRESGTHQTKKIDIKELEALLNSNTPLTLIDARTEEHFDNVVIPGAEWLSADAPDQLIEKTLPNKNQLIVVYCASEACPASKNLARRLFDKGYTNVLDYHGGINEWQAKNQPIEQLQG